MSAHHQDGPEVYDAVVVGARVGGAATALLLARAGKRVLLVDRSAPGRDTLSTHAFMRGGVLQLRRWGLLDELVAHGTPAVRRTVFRYVADPLGGPDAVATAAVDIRPDAGVDALYAPRRTLLDTVLVDAARAAGAEVRYGVSVTDVRRDRWGRVDGVTGTVRAGDDIRDGAGDVRPFEARARTTVGADGIDSTVARAVGAPVEVQGRAAGAALYSYVDDLPTEGYEWYYAPGATAGFIPTNDGQVCVFAGMPAAAYRAAPPVGDAGLLDSLAAVGGDALERVLAAGARSRPRRFPGLPGFLRRAAGPGWALVGDAGYFKDPLSTHGMTDALRDAELLARALLAGGDDPVALDASTPGYQEQRDRLSVALFAAVERVVSYEWTMDELPGLLRDVARSMADEVEVLSSLPPIAGVDPHEAVLASDVHV